MYILEHECLFKSTEEKEKCDQQIFLGAIKVCYNSSKNVTETKKDCPFMAKNKLGKITLEDLFF